ncbi:hypothetical protein [Tardiphaga sp.]|uniref:TY-Chap domain-containing protein n=1 Tax=Tardiphaga sp. TaxID=1926292 RepID=UPI00262D11DD|nr:hypothetical protein [Tardiphaga sp.]
MFGWSPADVRAQSIEVRIDDALQNITALVRPERIGYATFWDGNKFVQCRRLPDRQLRCEAAGTTMQPSLKSVLTGDRLNRLAALGWVIDPAFGSYVRTFPAEVPTAAAARHIVRALTEAYAANIDTVEMSTRWVADTPCPPRAGPSQNLAGSVNDMASMRASAVRSCSYVDTKPAAQAVSSSAELIALYGPMVTAEIQRLRINLTRRVWASFSTGIGYVQCMPETTPPAMLCEAQSSESWPALAAVLTPQRIARLHSAGYADPGRTPNYSKIYPLEKFTDAAIASELLTILYDVYNYSGATTLKVTAE